MNGEYKIRSMQPDEVQIAIDWAGAEGWNPGIHDADTLYTADPNGFFIGLLDGQPVAVGSAVRYDEQFGFCGLYIVSPDYRGRGYGLALTRARLDYLAPRNVGIDGVLENITLYERIGYRYVYKNIRYCGKAHSQTPGPVLKPLAEIPFEQLERYDRQCFPAQRSRFLHAWIDQPDALALGYVSNNQLLGYAVRRKCIEGHKIGPLFADDLAVAESLLAGLQEDIPGDLYYLDIPSVNPNAEKLVSNSGMEAVFATGRMYLQGKPDLAYDKLFGITTFELG